jgi:hypothetical protein
MFKERLLEALKSTRRDTSNGEISNAMVKIQKQKRLSSQEFQKVYDALWREGPAIKYQSGDASVKEVQSISRMQNP